MLAFLPFLLAIYRGPLTRTPSTPCRHSCSRYPTCAESRPRAPCESSSPYAIESGTVSLRWKKNVGASLICTVSLPSNATLRGRHDKDESHVDHVAAVCETKCHNIDKDGLEVQNGRGEYAQGPPITIIRDDMSSSFIFWSMWSQSRRDPISLSKEATHRRSESTPDLTKSSRLDTSPSNFCDLVARVL